MRERRLLVLAIAVAVAVTSGCSSWTLVPSELVRSGQQVYTQVQTMRLVADAALRESPPTVSLGVVLDDTATALSKTEEKIREIGGSDEELLELAGRAREELTSLRAAVGSSAPEKLRTVRRELVPIAERLAELGMS